MGALADAIMAYAQPLIDETDGSLEQMEKAMAISQACWNLAILPEEERSTAMISLGEALSMDEAESEYFLRTILQPMIRRHEEMFPRLHQGGSMEPPVRERRWSLLPAAKSSPQEKSPEPGRYDPCPCNSGKKYKFCCGRSARAM